MVFIAYIGGICFSDTKYVCPLKVILPEGG